MLHRGPAGDLYVFLNVKEIAGIQRDGINLYSTVSIGYTDAILGSNTQVCKLRFIYNLSEIHLDQSSTPEMIAHIVMFVPRLKVSS